jgi:hypothetical protein
VLGPVNDLRDVALDSETLVLWGRKHASGGTQFSGNFFKNLNRNPALLAAHYSSSIALGM